MSFFLRNLYQKCTIEHSGQVGDIQDYFRCSPLKERNMDYPELLYQSQDRVLLKKSDGTTYEESEFSHDKSVYCKLFVYASTPLARDHRFTVNITEIGSSSDLLQKVTIGFEKYLNVLKRVDEKKQRVKELTDIDQQAKVEYDWKTLVLQEQELRLSAEISNEYRLKETDSSNVDWIEYTATVVQPRLLESNGIPATSSNLRKLRVAAQGTDVFWVKYNRAKVGDYGAGDAVPDDVWLHDTLSQSMVHIKDVSLIFRRSLLATHSLQPNSHGNFGRPLVLLAGSES